MHLGTTPPGFAEFGSGAFSLLLRRQVFLCGASRSRSGRICCGHSRKAVAHSSQVRSGSYDVIALGHPYWNENWEPQLRIHCFNVLGPSSLIEVTNRDIRCHISPGRMLVCMLWARRGLRRSGRWQSLQHIQASFATTVFCPRVVALVHSFWRCVSGGVLVACLCSRWAVLGSKEPH